jgi:hypothetical protein
MREFSASGMRTPHVSSLKRRTICIPEATSRDWILELESKIELATEDAVGWFIVYALDLLADCGSQLKLGDQLRGAVAFPISLFSLLSFQLSGNSHRASDERSTLAF